VPLLVKFIASRDITTAAVASAASISAAHEPKLEATHPGADIPAVVVHLVVAMIVAFEPFVEVEYVLGDVVV
jgi:hypothetical protein